MTLKLMFSSSQQLLCLTSVPCRKMSLLYLPAWSWVDFNFKKFGHLSFKCKLDTTSDRRIPRYDSHKDLGLILSEDLYWDKHHKVITARAYKVLGLYNTSHYSLFSFYFHNGQTVQLCITGMITITLLHSNMASSSDERYLEH